MLLKNNRKNSDLQSQFNDFKKQILSSGQNPKQILSNLLASGKISQSQLNEVIQKAKDSHLI